MNGDNFILVSFVTGRGSPRIIRVIKSRSTVSAWHVAHVGRSGNAYRI